jgi:glutaredoxin
MNARYLLFSFFALINISNINTESLTEKTMSPQIKLFIYPGCPYCQKVIKYLKKINKFDEIVIKDATNADVLKELKSLTNNNTQCPYLSDEIQDVGMHESDDIITYFKTRFA